MENFVKCLYCMSKLWGKEQNNKTHTCITQNGEQSQIGEAGTLMCDDTKDWQCTASEAERQATHRKLINQPFLLGK